MLNTFWITVGATREVAAGQAVTVRSKIQQTNGVTTAGREGQSTRKWLVFRLYLRTTTKKRYVRSLVALRFDAIRYFSLPEAGGKKDPSCLQPPAMRSSELRQIGVQQDCERTVF